MSMSTAGPPHPAPAGLLVRKGHFYALGWDQDLALLSLWAPQGQQSCSCAQAVPCTGGWLSTLSTVLAARSSRVPSCLCHRLPPSSRCLRVLQFPACSRVILGLCTCRVLSALISGYASAISAGSSVSGLLPLPLKPELASGSVSEIAASPEQAQPLLLVRPPSGFL